MKKLSTYCAALALLATPFLFVPACTSAQKAEVKTAETEAKACLERADLKDCEIVALVDCVTSGTCETDAAAKAVFACLKVCRESDAGVAGAKD